MKSYISTVLILLTIVSILSGCSNNDSNVVSDDTTGILSIQNIAAPTQSGGSGTVSVKLIAPTGGPGSGAVTISSTNTTLISFAPSSQSMNSGGTATFYFTTATVTTDTVVPFTVSVGALTLTKSITLTASTPTTVTPPVVTSPSANSIAFVSASPTSITLKGAGGAGRTETSVVSFIVRDVAGQPLAGQTVNFTLDTSVGGLALIPVSAVSDSTGTVKTIVNAGVVSTPVRVTATVTGTTIAVKSDQLTVSTGLPHQDGLSLSASVQNPEALQYDGVEVPITAMLADHFSNPVPDGTAVYFTAYGGSIEPVGTTVNGITNVKWRSQSPRPVDGKIRILAYSIGEESFTDMNGNGLADPGEFTDLPEPFLSKSGGSTRNAAIDPFIDFNGDGVYNFGDGKFNGVLQGKSFVGAAKSIYVFKNYVFTMSGSHALISPVAFVIGQKSSTDITFTITDENQNSLPDKTTVTFSSASDGCTSGGFKITPTSKTVNNTGTQLTFTTTLDNVCTTSGSGKLTVNVKTPQGIESNQEIVITY